MNLIGNQFWSKVDGIFFVIEKIASGIYTKMGSDLGLVSFLTITY
jgi:hypothetical protein